MINSVLTKPGQDGWTSTILAGYSFPEFMDLDAISIHKHAKKQLSQYPAIWNLMLGL